MKKLKTTLLIIFGLVIFPSLLFTQNVQHTQSVRGVIIDSDTDIPVAGTTVVIEYNDITYVGQAGSAGEFKIEDVPIGKHTVKAFLLGYETVTLTNIEVSSAKETYLNIHLEMNVIETEEVIITASQGKNKPQNEMANVSARSFSVNENRKICRESW
jgi:hypothetical protein